MKTFNNLFIFTLLMTFVVLPKNGYSQNQADNWYFGNKAGLNFNNCTPSILTNGELNTLEGAATISDSSGNLLFYTDGITIWNKLHLAMWNGTGLLGHPSSTQSAVIVPKPGSPNHYYIFTPAVENTSTGLCYSIVDMSLDGGNGAVIEKNTLLSAGINEKVTAVRHANNVDVWVISRVFNSFEYRSWLINNSGISNAIISNSPYNPGSDHNKSRGYLKPSSDGSKLFCAFDDNLYSELSRFNNQTGQVHSVVKFNNIPGYLTTQSNDRSGAYGVEFSPNGKYMYLTSFVADRNFYLSQFDVNIFDSAIIHQSAALIDSGFSSINPTASEYAALQLAKNGKIYIARLNSFFLSVINQPDFSGSACNLVFAGQYLGGRRSMGGLPTFNQTYFDPHFRNYDYSYEEDCHKNVLFNLISAHSYDSLKWDFGDPASGISNFSTNPSAAHQYADVGFKNIKLVVYNFVGCRIITDTIFKNIVVGIDAPNLGIDTTICIGQKITLNAFSSRADSYLWNTASTASSIIITDPGMYWVDVTTGTCQLSDTIIIANKPFPVVDLGSDTSLCESKTLQLAAQNIGATYHWQDGSTLSNYFVNSAGEYHVSVNLNGCVKNDTIKVTALFKPVFSLGGNRAICENERIRLAPLVKNDWVLLWSDGSTNSVLEVSRPGQYSLKATNVCGTFSSTVTVKEGICDIYVPSAFTPNNDNLNDKFKILGVSQLAYFHIIIFNRYGKKIFESYDKNNGWNGLFNSQASDQGAYTYYLEYNKSNSIKKETRKGTFLLLR